LNKKEPAIIDQNLFVRWYRSSDGTTEFQKVTQSNSDYDYYRTQIDENGNKPKDDAIKVATGTTGTNGILFLGELEQGEYRLVETKAPDGYDLPEAAIKITVTESKVTVMQGNSLYEAVTKGHEDWVDGQTEDTKQIQVWNNPGFELPATGGPGTTMLYLLGSLLTGLAGTGLVMKRRKRNMT